jgi:hypothetical protein
MGGMAEADMDLAFQYHECALRMNRLIDWVDEAVKRLER